MDTIFDLQVAGYAPGIIEGNPVKEYLNRFNKPSERKDLKKEFQTLSQQFYDNHPWLQATRQCYIEMKIKEKIEVFRIKIIDLCLGLPGSELYKLINTLKYQDSGTIRTRLMDLIWEKYE